MQRLERPGPYPYHGATEIMDFVDEFIFEGLHLLLAEDGSVLNEDGSPVLQLVDGKFWVNNHAHVLRGSDDVDTRFLFYALSIAYAAPWVTGAVQLKINQKWMNKIEIHYPSRGEREFIVSRLKIIDDYIQNQKLKSSKIENFISALFRSWFIDFDPVKANAEGKFPYGMDEETAALFPNSFEDSGLGPIPAGWKVKKYSDCMDLKYGGALKTEERVDGEFPVIGSNGVVGIHNEYLVNGPGIVIGRKGNPGTVNWIDESFFPIDTTFYVHNKDENMPLEFLYHSLNYASLPWFSADSAVPGINRNVILQQRFISPPVELIEAFRKIAEIIIQKIRNKSSVMCSIESLRDAILPRLMSGELKVN